MVCPGKMEPVPATRELTKARVAAAARVASAAAGEVQKDDVATLAGVGPAVVVAAANHRAAASRHPHRPGWSIVID
jgi:hypothetical protein